MWVQKKRSVSFPSHMVDLFLGQHTVFAKKAHSPPTFSSSTTLYRGQKCGNTMCPTLLQQKQMHIGSLLFSDSPYSSQPLLTTECPPKTRAEEVPSQCMQPPSFLPKLIRFNPSPHSLQYRPSLFPQQENWRWPLNVASKCQLMLTGCTGRVFPKASWMAKPRHRHGKAGFWGQISARSGGLAVGFTRKPQFPWPDFYCIGMSYLLLKQWRGVLYPS